MSQEQARTILAALVHDGMDANKLSEKAKQEIRAAFEIVLALTLREG